MSFVAGLFGGAWTSISLFNLISFQKNNVHIRLLRQGGQQCTARIVRRFTRRVKTGKHGHRTAYMILTEFTTMQSISLSGRLRTERRITQEVEIGSDEWTDCRVGGPFEMCYLPAMPTICKSHPVLLTSGWIYCWVTVFVIPLGPPLGLGFVYWLGRDVTSLLLWIACVVGFFFFWCSGQCDTLHQGEELPAEGEGDAESGPTPSVHTFGADNPVVIGAALPVEAAVVVGTTVLNDVWRDLTDEQREAAKVLGYTRKKWDNSKAVPADDKHWVELSNDEREAAILLGYTPDVWDAEDA